MRPCANQSSASQKIYVDKSVDHKAQLYQQTTCELLTCIVLRLNSFGKSYRQPRFQTWYRVQQDRFHHSSWLTSMQSRRQCKLTPAEVLQRCDHNHQRPGGTDTVLDCPPSGLLAAKSRDEHWRWPALRHEHEL